MIVHHPLAIGWSTDENGFDTSTIEPGLHGASAYPSRMQGNWLAPFLFGEDVSLSKKVYEDARGRQRRRHTATRERCIYNASPSRLCMLSIVGETYE
jgi:hypothetical protein